MSNIPKLKFRVMSLEENIEIIKWAFFEDNGSLDVHKYTIEYFSELSLLNINDSKDKIYNTIEQVVTKYYNEYKNKIESETKRYNELWKEYNDKYFKMLSEFFKIDFPAKLEVIDAKVGLIPVFPRYLESFSFAVSTNISDIKLINISAHETLHFLWFEKWKALHPETPTCHYDSPYIEWKYSEMVTDPILNNKPFNELFNFEERGYDSFYELYDDDNLVMDNLRKIYSSDDNIDNKINDGYTYISNYFEEEMR